MTDREMKAANSIAGFCLGACVAAVLFAAYGLIQAQEVIDEAVAQQQVLACSRLAYVCTATETNK